jgi:hypothetical protein
MAGSASRTASHQAVVVAMTTAATAGSAATGARAASCGPGLGGCPPVIRANSEGKARAVRIRAVTPLTPSLTSIVPGPDGTGSSPRRFSSITCAGGQATYMAARRGWASR